MFYLVDPSVDCGHSILATFRALTATPSSTLPRQCVRWVALATKEGKRTTIEWRDGHLMISGGAVSGVKVVLDGRGEVIEERFELNARQGLNRTG